jgi:hypothetical protein
MVPKRADSIAGSKSRTRGLRSANLFVLARRTITAIDNPATLLEGQVSIDRDEYVELLRRKR